MSAEFPANWTPREIVLREGRGFVDWCELGPLRFTHPFYEQTLRAALQRSFGAARRETPLEFLEELHERAPGLAPSGFIFHLSRCGSTLVSQMLAAVPAHLVISEAPPLEPLLDPGCDASDEQRLGWLRGMVSALGRPRDEERRFFLKFDSWQMLDLPLIRRAFPEVPWIFLYRDPIEILVSHALRRGSQMIPAVLDPRRFGLPQPALTVEALETYLAQVLATIATAALEHFGSGRGRLVHYRELPHAGWMALLRHFRVEPSAEDEALTRAASARDAKNPARLFTGDTEIKRQHVTARLEALADTWLREPYGRLEALRLAQPAI